LPPLNTTSAWSCSHSDICHGKPGVRHMRWPVEAVLDLVSAGMSATEVQADHPELEPEDVSACLQYALLVVSGETIAHFSWCASSAMSTSPILFFLIKKVLEKSRNIQGSRVRILFPVGAKLGNPIWGMLRIIDRFTLSSPSTVDEL